MSGCRGRSLRLPQCSISSTVYPQMFVMLLVILYVLCFKWIKLEYLVVYYRLSRDDNI